MSPARRGEPPRRPRVCGRHAQHHVHRPRAPPRTTGVEDVQGASSGHAILGESSKKVAPWRQDVVAAAAAEIRNHPPGWTPIAAGVELLIEFYMPPRPPTGHPKTRRTIPDVTPPDLDKLIRSTCDALKTAGVYADDARVVEVSARKRYAVVDSTIGLDHEMVGDRSDHHGQRASPGRILGGREADPAAHGARAPAGGAPGDPMGRAGGMGPGHWRSHGHRVDDGRESGGLARPGREEGRRRRVEDGAIRLASIPGKPPLDRLQEAVVDYGQLVDIVLTVAAENTRAEDTAVRA